MDSPRKQCRLLGDDCTVIVGFKDQTCSQGRNTTCKIYPNLSAYYSLHVGENIIVCVIKVTSFLGDTNRINRTEEGARTVGDHKNDRSIQTVSGVIKPSSLST